MGSRRQVASSNKGVGNNLRNMQRFRRTHRPVSERHGTASMEESVILCGQDADLVKSFSGMDVLSTQTIRNGVTGFIGRWPGGRFPAMEQGLKTSRMEHERTRVIRNPLRLQSRMEESDHGAVPVLSTGRKIGSYGSKFQSY